MSEGYLVVYVPPRHWWQRRLWLVVHLAPTGRATARTRHRDEYAADRTAYALNNLAEKIPPGPHW